MTLTSRLRTPSDRPCHHARPGALAFFFTPLSRSKFRLWIFMPKPVLVAMPRSMVGLLLRVARAPAVFSKNLTFFDSWEPRELEEVDR